MYAWLGTIGAPSTHHNNVKGKATLLINQSCRWCVLPGTTKYTSTYAQSCKYTENCIVNTDTRMDYVNRAY